MLPAAETLTYPPDAEPPGYGDPGEYLDACTLRVRLAVALARLTEPQRAVIHCRFGFEPLTVPLTAAWLRLAPRTVEHHQHHALARLRVWLDR